jgi:hypothetical protein
MEVSDHLHAPADLPARKKPLFMESRLNFPHSGTESFREERIPARIRTPDRPARNLITIHSTLFPTPHSPTENACSKPNA